MDVATPDLEKLGLGDQVAHPIVAIGDCRTVILVAFVATVITSAMANSSPASEGLGACVGQVNTPLDSPSLSRHRLPHDGTAQTA